MKNNFRNAFSDIRATDEMKRNTIDFVCNNMKPRKNMHKQTALLVATCCIFAVCAVFGYGAYATPVSYISIDVNPSLEIALNRFERVVSAGAYGKDGELVLQRLRLKNKLYTDAVQLLLADEAFLGYLNDDALLSFTVVSEHESKLRHGIEQCTKELSNSTEFCGANPGLVEEAHLNGLSFGKYRACLELLAYDDSITADDCKDMSMRQIRERTQEHKNAGGNGHSGGKGGDITSGQGAHHKRQNRGN